MIKNDWQHGWKKLGTFLTSFGSQAPWEIELLSQPFKGGASAGDRFCGISITGL